MVLSIRLQPKEVQDIANASLPINNTTVINLPLCLEIMCNTKTAPNDMIPKTWWNIVPDVRSCLHESDSIKSYLYMSKLPNTIKN